MVRSSAVLTLGLSLVACGGAETPADETGEPVTEAIAAGVEVDPPDVELREWLAANYADMGQILYRSGETDLNGDGNPEILAYLGGPMMCGSGGCNLVVLQRTGQGLDVIGDLSVSRLPVGVFSRESAGWKDLAVSIYGGGGPSGVARVPFADGAYASNPTVPPAELTEQSYETIIEDGELEPLD